MAKTYEVMVDVVMSGYFYIEADTPEEAEKAAKDKSVVASDLRHFCCNRIDILDVEECEE